MRERTRDRALTAVLLYEVSKLNTLNTITDDCRLPFLVVPKWCFFQ